MTAAAAVRTERVWDPLVRASHWLIAAAVVLNGLIVEEESAAHIWIGYVAFGVLALRLLWGFVGPETARFSSFPPSLSGAMAHIQEIREGRGTHYRTHNPLGALMAYALWGLLLVVSLTGLALDEGGPREAALSPSLVAAAALADEDEGEEGEGGEGGESAMEELHEGAANALLLLAALHVAGVGFESRRSGVNLARAMIDGDKRFPDGAA